MIQNLICGILFLKIDYFGNATCLYPFTRARGHHQSFSISDLLAESLNVRKKSHFIIQFCSKNLPHFTNLNLLDTENNMLPQHSQQSFWLYKVSMKSVSVWCQKKAFLCTISWSPRTTLLKQISVCFCISP